MEKETIDKLLHMFVDPEREKIKHPFPCGEWQGKEWVCATDGHCMILVPRALAMKYGEVEQSPDAIRILPPIEVDEPVPMEALEVAIRKIDMVTYPVTEKCDVCEGAGMFEHGSHRYNCKECDETGVIAIPHLATKELDRNAAILWGETMLRPKYMAMVVEALKLMGGSPRVVNRKPTRIFMEAGGKYLLAAGILQDDDTISKSITV